MMRRAILWTLILVITISDVTSKSVKTIEKRDICSNNGCSACDGRSCNSCNNNNCCSTVSCNQCVTNCARDCVTQSCNRNCVSGCTATCQESNSNCAARSCSQCLNRCSNNCSSRSCVNDCSRGCGDCSSSSSSKSEKIEDDETIILGSSEPTQVIVNNTNNNLVNLTTHVNINNVVHNFNNISIPVYVNTTNINNINLSDAHESTISESGSPSGIIDIRREQQPQLPIPIPFPIPQPYATSTNNCCYVLHPKQCYTDSDGNQRCFIRRTRECSDACTSPVVTIEQDYSRGAGCQRVGSWPYSYCGNYARRDCNQCYTCGGSYNPSQCFRRSGCSDTCRSAAPNCVPSQSGLQCY